MFKLNKYFQNIISIGMVSLLCCLISATELDFTVEVRAGEQECFYQKFGESTEVEIDYQVIDGGDLDINVLVINLENTYIHADHMKTENVIKFQTTAAGDYKFCFDNSFSRISHKVVYFELFANDGEEDKDDDDEDGFDPEKLTFESENLQGQLDMTVKDFVGMLDRTKNYLERSLQVQTLIKMHEAKDRNIQENNFFRVNFFSSVQLAVMLTVSLIQVFLIRSLFKERIGTKGESLKQRT